MNKEEKFWDWFYKNKSIYYSLNQIKDIHAKEKLLDTFLEHLHDYCNKLYFEIGGKANDRQELIISAAGDKDYFEKAEKLVLDAPDINDWIVIALKPAMGIEFVTNYEGVEINPKKTWFLPLENRNEPRIFGIRLYFESYKEKEKNTFLDASYQMLDTFLGEKFHAYNIDYLEADKLPVDPKHDGLIELEELPNYISWRRKLNFGM